MSYIKKYWKIILGVILFSFILYFTIYLLTPKRDMSDLNKYKLDELNKEIDLIIENQKNLTKKIKTYEDKLLKIDSVINKIKIQKITVNKYYKEKSEKITNMDSSDIDKFFHERYKY